MPNFKIIDDQKDFIVVDKSENVDFHDEGNIGQGLHSQVCQYYGGAALFPVHRLDKMTSGLVVFAKNLPTAQQFQEMFHAHRIEKYYIALSVHKPKKKQGLIKGDMKKSRRGMYKLLRSVENPALTQFFSYALANGSRLFLLKPHSGKTHQIRVALNSISASILGDPLYEQRSDNVLQSDRGYLHAYALKFELNNAHYHYVLAPSQGDFFTSSTCINQLSGLGDPSLLNWPTLK